MDRFQQLLKQVADRIGLLTVSQRLALGLCAALIVVSLLWLMQWSTEPDLVSLVNYEFALDELDAVEDSLSASGRPFEIRGTRVYVRAADRHNVLRVLHSADALPEGSLYDMASVVSDDNPFRSPESRVFAQNFAKGNELAKIIATSPGVKKAAVLINPKTKRRVGGQSDVPTASIHVTLAPGREMSMSMVEAFATLVSGAVAGLRPHNVFVMDARTMRSYHVPSPDDPGSADYLSMVKERESHYVAKIMGKLGDIPGLRASVTVELDSSKSVKQTQTYHQPQLKTETSKSSEQSARSSPTEAGVQPNLGQAVTQTQGGGSESTEDTLTENFEPQLSEKTTVEKFPFSTKHVTATVGIPHSFIVGVFRARHPDKGESPPDDDNEYVAVRDAELARVRASVERIIMAKSPDDVVVDVYPDMTWSPDGTGYAQSPVQMVSADLGGEDESIMGFLTRHGPQVGLAGLAAISLVMMMRIARKSPSVLSPAVVSEDAGEPESGDEPFLSTGAQAVGQASAAEGFLMGKEVGEEVLRAQELGAEVSKLVTEDPQGTADILRRWMEEPV